MTWVVPFYAMPPVVHGESRAPDTFTPDRMVWHNNNICTAGESIPYHCRVSGEGGLEQCPACARM
jgi:hypothetical protein